MRKIILLVCPLILLATGLYFYAQSAPTIYPSEFSQARAQTKINVTRDVIELALNKLLFIKSQEALFTFKIKEIGQSGVTYEAKLLKQLNDNLYRVSESTDGIIPYSRFIVKPREVFKNFYISILEVNSIVKNPSYSYGTQEEKIDFDKVNLLGITWFK